MKKGDIILVVCIIITSLVSIYLLNFSSSSTSKKYIEVVVDGKVYKKVFINDLNYEQKIRINTKEGYNLVHIHDGKVEIIEADCKDKICVNTASIDKKGQIIACLPHKLYVKILGFDDEVDNVSY